jgi:hypothetical protein
MRPTHLALCTGLLLATATGVAHAQAGSSVAEQLFDEGQRLLDEERFDEACEKLRESDKIEPAVGTKLNLAVCEEARGHIATAWALFQAVLDLLPESDRRRPFAAEHESALAPRIPYVMFVLAEGAPADTTAKMGEMELSAASFGTKLPLDPGEQSILVEAPGHEPRRVELTLAEAEQREVVLEPGPERGAAPAAPAAAPEAAPPPPSPKKEAGFSLGRQGAGFIVGAVGVGGLALGAVSGVLTLNKRAHGNDLCPSADNCTQAGADALDEARTFRTLTNIGLAVGVLGVGIGGYLVLTADDDDVTEVGATWVNGPEVSVRRSF